MIITVKEGDSLYSISQEYGVPIQKIASDNAVEDNTLVVGQSLYVGVARRDIFVSGTTQLLTLSNEYSVSEKTLFRNNYVLSGNDFVLPNTYLVLEYRNVPILRKIIGGYAYDFINRTRLSSVINYLTYVMPFTYGFDREGGLIVPNVDYIVSFAKENDVKPLLHISTLTNEGVFDSNLATAIFENEVALPNLINNIVLEVENKGYFGVDVDFEYLVRADREKYARFLTALSERLHETGKISVVALPPKTDDEQTGSLVEGIDYALLGKACDYALIMAYEYGYRFGPAQAIAPVNRIRQVLDYATSKIENSKILLGLSNYGYDWTLPYVSGMSDAPSISTVEAIRLAKRYGSEIFFDEIANAPYFYYTDENKKEHEVWFEDARSFSAKCDLALEYDLAGGFIWEISRDNPQAYVTINSRVLIE